MFNIKIAPSLINPLDRTHIGRFFRTSDDAFSDGSVIKHGVGKAEIWMKIWPVPKVFKVALTIYVHCNDSRIITTLFNYL